MPLPKTTRQDLDRHLCELGLSKGDNIVVHSRLLSFGLIEGWCETVYCALRDAIGSQGTIAVPTYTLYLPKGEIYDVKNTPSQKVGDFPEFVRKLPGAVRSRCPMHNHAAIGPKAELLRQSLGTVSLGKGSDFELLHDAGFSLLYLGCDFKEAATFNLHIEALVGVPFREWVTLDRLVRHEDDGLENIACNYYIRKDLSKRENHYAFQNVVLDADIARQARCHFATSYFMSMADVQKVVIEVLLADPNLSYVQHISPR